LSAQGDPASSQAESDDNTLILLKLLDSTSELFVWPRIRRDKSTSQVPYNPLGSPEGHVMSLETEAASVSASLLPLEEQIAVVRQRIERDTVRVSTVTNTTEKHVAEEILHERVEVEHIAIGRPIDTVPPVREEGEVTIIPIVEEVLVIEKRLILKEEVHIRRIRVPDVHREVVTLRTQDVVVERTKARRDAPQFPAGTRADSKTTST
jgi:stress response protein YsnF